LPPASSAATCAAYGVDFLDPLKPFVPADDQATTFPCSSAIDIIVLLNVELTNAIPEEIFFLFLFFFFTIFFTTFSSVPLFSVSVFLELMHFIIPNRGFEVADLRGNVLGVLLSLILYKLLSFRR